MMNKDQKERGSTFIIVVLVIGILGVIGAVLLGMTTVNLKMQAVDRSVKRTMYYTESGLDQVYALVSTKVDAAFEQASALTYTFLDGIADDPEFLLEDKQTLDFVKVQEEANNKFREYFKDYFNVQMDLTKWKLLLENDEDINNVNYYKISDSQSQKPYVKIPDGGYVTLFSVHSAYRFPITVTFIDTNQNMQKTINTDIVIKEPDFNFPLYLEENTMKDNPIFSQTLVSSRDITVTSNATINNGGIYAKGIKGNIYNSETNGGIIVENGGRLTVNGASVITDAYLQTRYSNGQIIVNHPSSSWGQIYADSVVLQKNSVNGRMTFNYASLYVKDDMELNGEKSVVNIRGDYYGFSTGGDSPQHDSSSSILVNTSDIGAGSSLDITEGEVMIGGTAYIRLEDGPSTIAYQTGESIAIRGNYIAYTNTLGSSAVKLKSFGDIALHLIVDAATEQPLGSFALKNHFFSFYDYYIRQGHDPSILNLNGINIDKSRFLYTTGAKICRDGASTIVDTTNTLSLGIAGPRMQGMEETYRRAVHYLDIDIPQIVDSVTDKNKTPYDFYVNDLSGDVTKQTLCKNSSGFFTVDEKSYSGGTLHIVPTTYLFYYNPTTKPIRLVNSGTNSIHEGDSEITINHNGTLRGLIVSEGTVRVVGQINYEGSILSKGHIVLSGGTQTFTHSKRAIGRAIEQNPNVRQYLFSNYYLTVLSSRSEKHYFRISDAISYVEDVFNANNLNYLYNQVIDFEYWTIK